MEKVYSKLGISALPNIKIRFGQETSIKSLWKNIIEIDDIEERQKRIDDLLEIMEADEDKSGFLGKEDRVDCGKAHCFLLDDKNLYYMFFDNLRQLSKQNLDGKATDGAIIHKAIKETIKQYAGGNGVNRELRQSLTELVGEDATAQSISQQKGKNCFYCTERAAISHNLWLLTGATSYFCWTDNDNFGADDSTYKNDTHNFTIVEYDDKFRLYDIAMNNFCMLENDCIEKLLDGKGLKVEKSKTVPNPGVYAENFNDQENA